MLSTVHVYTIFTRDLPGIYFNPTTAFVFLRMRNTLLNFAIIVLAEETSFTEPGCDPAVSAPDTNSDHPMAQKYKPGTRVKSQVGILRSSQP